ncbi:MAG: cytochrome c3 family protein [Pseudomonadota bacterium]
MKDLCQRKRKHYISSLAIILLLAGWMGVCHASGGAYATKCFTCHKDLQKELNLSAAHSPFKQLDCGSCHSPHTSNYQGLIKQEVGDVCKSCHKDKAISRGFVHAPVERGECTKCHDPHASFNQALLSAAKGELCFKCHKPESIFMGSKKHSPAEKGECLKCHNPHGSDNPAMIRQSDGTLCLSCHAANQARMQNAHNFSKGEEINCLSCHSPHGSDNNSFIRKNQHAPFREKKCNTCHGSPSPTSGQDIKDKSALACLQCHENTKETFLKVNSHIQAGLFCIDCHSPHASDYKGMVKGSLERNCLSCHTDTYSHMKNKKVKYQHPEIKNCSNCHNPHGSNERLLFADEVSKVCSKCHDRHVKFSHPIGKDTIDPRSKRDIDCLTCHGLMGTEHRFALRFDRSKQLCVQCHMGY